MLVIAGLTACSGPVPGTPAPSTPATPTSTPSPPATPASTAVVPLTADVFFVAPDGDAGQRRGHAREGGWISKVLRRTRRAPEPYRKAAVLPVGTPQRQHDYTCIIYGFAV
ncbi:MAG: hypothetical protein ACP5J4_05810 [Anaerolineae bacterium]